jgi:P4 family phage/plasmid primase-like protien
MGEERRLLDRVLEKLDRGDCPDRKWPDRRGEFWPLCPFHADEHSGSFSVSERGFACFACGARGSLRQLAERLGVLDAHPNDRPKSGLTLVEYARVKCLPMEFLRSLGVRERQNQYGTYLEMPYRDEQGNVVALRMRFSLDGGRRFAWRRGSILIPYGLWIPRESDWVLIVEGESDAQTAWFHGLPALGIPGARTWRDEWAKYVTGKRIYVWAEPDEGGRALVEAMSRTVPIEVMSPPDGVKDLSDAHLQGYDVRALIEEMRGKAMRVEHAPDKRVKPNAPALMMGRFYPRPFSVQVMSRTQFLSTRTDERGDLWRYDQNSGLWRDDGESYVENLLRSENTLPDDLKKRNIIAEIIADIRGLSWRESGLPEPDVHLIPFRNGVLDLRTGSLRAYRPEDHFTFSLPWAYNPRAKSAFIAEKLANFPAHIQRHFMELLAYCLWRKYPFQRFFLWYGRGQNGKGFLANVLTYALGVENVAGVTLTDLQSNRFAAASLWRKLANIAGEVAYQDLESTDLLKKLCGNDWLQAERKYRDPVPFKNSAKLVFLTNSVPKTRDTTDAFYRRVFLVHFDCHFSENPAVLNELELIAHDPARSCEFEWLLAQAVRTLQELCTRNFVMTGALAVEEAKALYERLSNPLRQFLEERCEVTHQADDFIFKFEFREALNTWLAERGLNAYTDQRLGREMSELGFESGQRGENKWWAWLGLRWAPLQSQDSRDSQDISNNFPERSGKLFVETRESRESCDLGNHCLACGGFTDHGRAICDRCLGRSSLAPPGPGDSVYLVTDEGMPSNPIPWRIDDVVERDGQEYAIFEGQGLLWPLKRCVAADGHT